MSPIQDHVYCIKQIYTSDHSFQCLNTEYLNHELSVHNCSSPYITDKKELWCKGKSEATSDVQIVMNWKFCNARMDNDHCYPPCQYTEYKYFQALGPSLDQPTYLLGQT